MGSSGPRCVRLRFWDVSDLPLGNAGAENPGIVEMDCYLRCLRTPDDERCLEKTLGMKLWIVYAIQGLYIPIFKS